MTKPWSSADIVTKFRSASFFHPSFTSIASLFIPDSPRVIISHGNLEALLTPLAVSEAADTTRFSLLKNSRKLRNPGPLTGNRPRSCFVSWILSEELIYDGPSFLLLQSASKPSQVRCSFSSATHPSSCPALLNLSEILLFSLAYHCLAPLPTNDSFHFGLHPTCYHACYSTLRISIGTNVGMYIWFGSIHFRLHIFLSSWNQG